MRLRLLGPIAFLVYLLLLIWAASCARAYGQTTPAPGARTLIQGAQGVDSTRLAWPVTVSGTTSANVVKTLRVDSNGQLVIATATTSSTTGTIAALDGAVTLTSLSGLGVVGVQITGTWTATLTFQGSVDGTNYVTLTGQDSAYAGPVTATTANGVFLLYSAGYASVRVIATAYTSGTATVTLLQAANPHAVPTRTANAADGTTGVGLLGAGQMVFDGTNWQSALGDTSGNPFVEGSAANGASGSNVNPVVTGFISNENASANWWLGHNQNDNKTNGAALPWTAVIQQEVNSATANATTSDRRRNNVEQSIITATGATSSQSSSDFVNWNAKGIIVYTNVTVNPGSAQTLTINLQAKDEVGGDGYYTVATSGAIAVFGAAAGATGLEVICCYPGASETAALAGWTTQALPLPRTWRVSVTHSDAGAWTYTTTFSYVQ